MNALGFVDPSEIRAQFSRAMSEMYRAEVPLYADLLDLVANTNRSVLENSPETEQQLRLTSEIDRLSNARHGAIRVGTKQELSTILNLPALV